MLLGMDQRASFLHPDFTLVPFTLISEVFLKTLFMALTSAKSSRIVEVAYALM